MPKEHKFFENVEMPDDNDEKIKLIDSLNKLKAMSVQEFTFYKKWEEIRQPEIKKYANRAFTRKIRIWKPTDINNLELTLKEIEALEPEVVFVGDNEEDQLTWLMLRLFCHTMEFSQSPGRFLRFLIVDKPTNKILGVTSIASDVISITDRDNYLGWTSDNRLVDKKLAHSTIGSCIMATQPFGYNFLGGKLVACLVTSEVVRNKWKELYDQVLAGMTTTSLYGSYSMYNNIPWWHKCGSSSGKMLIKPDQVCYDKWHQIIKDKYPDKYKEVMTQKEGINGPVTGAKTRVLSMIMNECGVKQKDFVHGYERGVYYSCFYENTREFLCNKIDEKKLVMKPRIKDDVKSIMDWWKPKAINRYKKLHLERNLKPNVLFYDEMIQMSYKEAKNKFFKDVGEGK